MTTLEEASRTCKRNRTFVGRPQPIRSGIKLTKVKPAANRSDFLLDDQMFLVKDLQDALENAINCYGNAKSEDDKVLSKIKIDDLKAKCEEMVLVLKVVDKINRELMYARVELTRAAKVGRHVQVARKRVAWLEDRREKLLMKYRRPPSSRLQKIEKSAFLSDSDEDYPAKIPTTADAALPDPYSSNYWQNTFSSLDPVLPTSPVCYYKSKNPVDHSLPQYVFPESSFKSIEVVKARRLKKKLPLKQRPKSDGAGRVVFKPEKSILKSSQSSRSFGGGDAVVGASQYREQTEVSIYPQNSVTTVNTPEVYSEISDSRPSTRHRSKRQLASSQQQRTGSRGSDGGVFITEGTEEDLVKVLRKVSVISPQRSDEEEEDEDDEDAEEEFDLTRGELQPPPSRGRSVATDATDEYWMSDHHRFEYNQFVDALIKDNPRSYHSLGIAVQSTFMSPANTGGPELPWLNGVTAGNMGDAQSWETVTKIALDKLSERIHKMYSKVEDAAMQSAQLAPTPVETEPTLLTTVEGRMNDYPQKQGFESKPESTKSIRSVSVTAANNNETTSDPATENQASEAQSQTQKMNQPEATVSDHVKQQGAAGLSLLYHPPAIPAPEVLPLTRTNPSKVYPRISSDWNDVDPDPIPPTIRLVNQMNVAKETSLLLYKNKESKRTGFTLPVKKKPGKKSQTLKNVSLANHPILAASKVAAMMANRKSADALKLDKDSLKWKRIENLIYEKLISKNIQERRDAAMHLGSLQCVNEEVFAALIQRVEEDKDAKVRYSASKSLISLGCWRPVPIAALLNYLKSSDQPIQSDIVKTIISARNVHFVNKNQPVMKELIEKLKEFCQSDSAPELAYNSAVCLGCLCEQNRTAKRKLLQSLQDKDSNTKAQSLEILVRQMHATESEVIQTILTQLQTSPVGRHRSAAANLLIFLGSVCIPTQEAAQNVFSVLEQRLYNDPVKDVRVEIANAITALGMKSWLMDIVEKRLEDDDDSVRTSAVISVGVLGMKSDKVIRVLIDMLELDSSEYVRLMVIRTFAQLGVASIKIMRSLKDKERSGGPLGREASNALKILQGLGSQKPPKNAGLPSPSRSPHRVASPNRAGSPAQHRSSVTMSKNRKDKHKKAMFTHTI
ncbi:uncharacterized protein LOC117104106 isoform X2 [Anneissia japonica]|uniref:uncharacterized protein LOC117104106 isoform X2 n=1 Tax=Anneissia japonica TaxID=1529436 RepID=UPI001425736D|nr:uncharacterized protein LOC117104106 isoform X2 [Anneissia japonica]